MAKQNGLPLTCPHCGKVLTEAPAPGERRRRLAAWKSLFHHFWEQFPHKVAKGEAIEAWARLAPPPTEPGLETRLKWIMGKLENYRRHEWGERNRDTIPYPATFLNRIEKDLRHGE